MLVGCYYRCPIVIEEGDKDHPRFYVLAQLDEYNEIADAIKVKMHDLLGSRQYYEEIFQHNVFFAQAVARCEASPGGVVDSRWGRGIVVSRASEPYAEDKPYWYWIKFPNGKYAKECETELKFDYSQMNYAPDKQLRAYEFQHPTWFINHLKVSKNLHLVNNATYGFRVLAGCRAFLLPHQISTVARCFETTPVRYMLADEVGLGKTVEACSVLSILASENKDLRVLIVVPGALAINGVPLKKPPVYIIPITQHIINETIGNTRSITLPLPFITSGLALAYGLSGVVYKSPLAALSS